MTAWLLTDHLCRACFGRVLKHAEEPTWRCSNCGLSHTGGTHASICACGIKLRNGRNAGLRCTPNNEPTPELPGEIVVVADT